MRSLTAVPLCLLIVAHVQPQRTEKPGLKTPGIQIPVAQLKPDAVYPVPGAPDWLAVDDHVWVSNKPRDSVARLDPNTNTVVATINTGQKPCSGLAVGFASLWVPNCGDSALARVDLKTGQVTAAIPTTIADSEGGLAVGAASVWMMVDRRGTLVRFDPATNKPVAEIHLPPGSFAVAFGEGAVW